MNRPVRPVLRPGLPTLPRRAATQRRQPSRRGWLALIATALVFLGVWGAHHRWLRVSGVTLEEPVLIRPAVVPAATLQAVVGGWRGQSMLLVSTDRLALQLRAATPALDQVSVVRTWPDRLDVTYQQRVPLCQVVAANGTFIIDRDGLVFGKASSDTLPTLTLTGQSISVGDRLSASGVSLGLALAKGFRGPEDALTGLSVAGDEVSATFAGKPPVLLRTDARPERMVQVLEALFRTFRADNRVPQRIDLRFDQPVLAY